MTNLEDGGPNWLFLAGRIISILLNLFPDCRRIDYMITGLLLILAGLLIAIFSGPIARFHIAMNKRLLGVELPFEWSRAAGVLLGALVSFSGLLKLI